MVGYRGLVGRGCKMTISGFVRGRAYYLLCTALAVSPTGCREYSVSECAGTIWDVVFFGLCDR